MRTKKKVKQNQNIVMSNLKCNDCHIIEFRQFNQFYGSPRTNTDNDQRWCRRRAIVSFFVMTNCALYDWAILFDFQVSQRNKNTHAKQGRRKMIPKLKLTKRRWNITWQINLRKRQSKTSFDLIRINFLFYRFLQCKNDWEIEKNKQIYFELHTNVYIHSWHLHK